MRQRNNILIASATDLSNHLACPHLTSLNRAVAFGELEKPTPYDDPGAEALKQRGLDHEQRILQGFRDQGLTIEEIPRADSSGSYEAWSAAGARLTTDAMRRGVDVVYQGRLYDGRWSGYPDFLRRVETPSNLGDWSYEVVDAKLSREAKGRAVLQISLYSDLLAGMQGIAPRQMHLALGGPVPRLESFHFEEYSAYYRAVRKGFEEHVGGDGVPVTYPEPVEHCHICDWRQECNRRRRRDDHLSLVAGISRSQRSRLVERGVSTLAALGEMEVPVRPRMEGVSDSALVRIREQARIQYEGRITGRHLHEILVPIVAEQGLASLPAPSPGDLFFDIEGDQYALEEGLEYLFGLADVDGSYQGFWALDRATERAQFERFIDLVIDRLEKHPDLHVYHYAPYERTAVQKLMGRYATRESEVDRLLRGGVFVDLYRAVRQGLRASVESYSIKKMEAFYGYQRAVELRSATGALAQFEAWLQLGVTAVEGQELPAIIEGYNRDDCLSTLRLRNWLESLRAEHEKESGESIPRPLPPDPNPSVVANEAQERIAAVFAQLVDGVPEDEAERSAEQQARWILAHLLDFHRREEKAMWWEYFYRCGLSDEELLEDRATLGGLVYEGVVERVKRSEIHRYWFPEQEHEIEVGDSPRDPVTGKAAGVVVAVDDHARTIDLKRSTASEAPHPAALIPLKNISHEVLRESLFRLATSMLAEGFEPNSRRRASWDLLCGAPPRVGQAPGTALIAEGEAVLEASCGLVLSLDRSVLPIQGPPGSGKTYSGARMITALLKAGKRVGVTSNSHKVISNLLRAVCEAAKEEGVNLRGIQKVKEEGGTGLDEVAGTTKNEDVLRALENGSANLAAGTAWLWAREEMAQSVDVLFVDEAGQMSLANVLAVSQAAGSLVLLGDPQQLDQPFQGAHPPGVAVSALTHLLGKQATIAPDLGVFLPDTWRMHPLLCDFTSEQFYQRRLTARADLVRQEVRGSGPLAGRGLRFVPVGHTGNKNESPEEVEHIAAILAEFLATRPTWVDRLGKEHPVTLAEILVVSPYNAQVAALKVGLPGGAAVGTVDKFQGQEAPIVIYSMATSTPEDAPRGMEFLYSLNRFNVATSRARCVVAVVGNPALMRPDCRSPRQMRLANAVCRFMEMVG